MHSSYKKRKEKKLNMQGKGNMVLGYFIINIHMQLRRKEAGYNSSNFLKPKGEFTLRKTHTRRTEAKGALLGNYNRYTHARLEAQKELTHTNREGRD